MLIQFESKNKKGAIVKLDIVMISTNGVAIVMLKCSALHCDQLRVHQST